MDYILASLAKQNSRVNPVYVNCDRYSTQMGVYSQLMETLKLSIPRQGWPADAVFNRICEQIDQDGIPILLVLDQVQRLIMRGNEELLNSIAMANEEPKARFGLIGISNERQVLERLSRPLRTALGFTTIEFDEYSTGQLRAILTEKAEIALTEGSWSDSILDTIARIAKANGANALLSLDILRKAARHAERRNSRKIELLDIRAVYAGTDHAKISLENYCAAFEVNPYDLSEDQKLGVRILAQNGEMTSSEFYGKFLAVRNIGKRQVRYTLASLGAKGLVKSQSVKRPGILDGKKIQLRLRR